MDNAAFMDDFFSEVNARAFLNEPQDRSERPVSTCYIDALERSFSMICLIFQIDQIRNSIDKIDENVAEVKKLYSVILSAPTSDQSKTHRHHTDTVGTVNHKVVFKVMQCQVHYKYLNSILNLLPFFFFIMFLI